MKLTARQRDIIAFLELQADLPTPRAGDALGMSPNMIRRELMVLEEASVIAPSYMVNCFALGYELYDTFFSISSVSKREVARVEGILSSTPEVTWFVVVGGAYQYGISLAARSSLQAQRVLSLISERLGRVFARRDLSTVTRIVLLPRRYLSAVPQAVKSIDFSFERVVDVDAIDMRILGQVSTNPASRGRDIARATGLPASTVAYRLQKLQSAGVLKGKAYVVNHQTYGAQAYRFHVTLNNTASSTIARIWRYAEACPYCTTYVERLGSFDISLRIETPDGGTIFSTAAELRELIGPDLVSIDTIPIFAEKRFCLFPLSQY